MSKSFNGLQEIVAGKLGEDPRSVSVVKRLQRIAKAGKKIPQAASETYPFLKNVTFGCGCRSQPETANSPNPARQRTTHQVARN